MDVTETHSDYFMQHKKLTNLYHHNGKMQKCIDQQSDNDTLLMSCQRKFVLP